MWDSNPHPKRDWCINIVYLFEHILLTYFELTQLESLWRNRLARQTVNLKVGGSSPPRDEYFLGLSVGRIHLNNHVYRVCSLSSSRIYDNSVLCLSSWLGGATVARLTPDQKVACSNHVRVIQFFCVCSLLYEDVHADADFFWTKQNSARSEDRTHDLQIALKHYLIMRLTRYLLRYPGTSDTHGV